MNRLFVFADLHGYYSAWLTAQALMSKGDGLAVAGDLFDTRYGSYTSPDYGPDSIRSDLKEISHPFHYVYGNCDVPSYFKGYDNFHEFEAFGKRIFLHHGHRPLPHHCHADIIIQGHTHLCQLEEKNGQIFLNPGSIVLPRNNLSTYGIIDKERVCLKELKTGKTLISVSI